MKNIILALPLLVITSLANAQEVSTINNETEAIKSVVDSLYASFTIKDGKLPNYEVTKSYFVDNARMGGFQNMRIVDDYLSRMKEGLTKANLQLLKEWEVFGKTEVYGHIAQHISTYVVYVNTMEKIAQRGVISYQLVKRDGRWRVLSMVWDIEDDNQPIPDRFLPHN